MCCLRTRMYKTQTNIYIGQTGDQLNNRFNKHSSDIRCHLNHCEISKHFFKNVWISEKDPKISILEKVKSTEAKRQYKADSAVRYTVHKQL